MPENNKLHSSRKMHYAWAVCLGCVFLFFSTCGLGGNTAQVYYPFLVAERGFTKTQISLMSTVRGFSSLAALYVSKPLYKRISLRAGLVLGGVFTVAGYVCYAVTKSYIPFLSGCVLGGIGYGFTTLAPISTLLDRWFASNKTLALSIASASSGLAVIVSSSPLTFCLQKFGIEKTYLIEASFMALLAFGGFAMIRNFPEDKGVRPFGEGKSFSGAAGGSPAMIIAKPDLSAGRALLASAMAVFSTIFASTAYGNISMLSSTAGFTPQKIAAGVSLLGAALMVGKLIYGELSEKISVYTTSVIYMLMALTGIGMLCMIDRFRWMYFPGIALFGASVSAVSLGMVSWVHEWFPLETHAKLLVRFQMLYTIGGIVNSIIPGVMADNCGGSYFPFFYLSIVSAVATLITVMYLYRCTGYKLFKKHHYYIGG